MRLFALENYTFYNSCDFPVFLFVCISFAYVCEYIKFGIVLFTLQCVCVCWCVFLCVFFLSFVGEVLIFFP